MSEDWGGWDCDQQDRARAIAHMTPLQRLEWLERTLLLWGEDRLRAERKRRQAEVDAWWALTST